MSTKQNKAILRQWACEMWGGGDLALVDELASAEYVYDQTTQILDNLGIISGT